MFENPRRDRQATNFTSNVSKILDLKSSSEQIFSENWRWVPLKEASASSHTPNKKFIWPLPATQLGLECQEYLKKIDMQLIILVWHSLTATSFTKGTSSLTGQSKGSIGGIENQTVRLRSSIFFTTAYHWGVFGFIISKVNSYSYFIYTWKLGACQTPSLVGTT